MRERNMKSKKRRKTARTRTLKHLDAGEAAEVMGSLEAVDDIDNLNSRAGPSRWGYMEPSEAACEICDEAVESFQEDMKRRLKMGDRQGALAVCQGIVWGLYQARSLDGGTVGWAGEDWLGECAAHAVGILLDRGPGRKLAKRKQKPGAFPCGFFDEKTPEWAGELRRRAGVRRKK